MNRTQQIALTVVGLVILLVVGFWLTHEGNNSASIKIGLIMPLTGNSASFGEPSEKAAILATEEINAKGGVNGQRLELIAEDGKCDAKAAVDAANKLINVDQVTILITGCSSESLAVAPIANEHHVIQMASLTSANSYTMAGDYSFRTFPSADYYVGKLGDFAYLDQNRRKMAILFEQKDFPASTAASFKKSFESQGGIIVSEQSFVPDEINWRTYLLKINLAEVDSLFFAASTETQMIQFFTTMKELGLREKLPVLTSNLGVTKNVFDQTSGLNQGVYTTDLYVNANDPATKKMLTAYKERYGDYPKTNYYYVAENYELMYLFADAIRSCNGTQADCIKDYLYRVKDRAGAWGNLSIDANGDGITTIGLHHFDENGKEVWTELGKK